MVSGTAVAGGSALALVAAARLVDVPTWATEAGLMLVVSGVIGFLLPVVLPAKLVEVRSTPSTRPESAELRASLAPGVRAHTGGEGTTL